MIQFYTSTYVFHDFSMLDKYSTENIIEYIAILKKDKKVPSNFPIPTGKNREQLLDIIDKRIVNRSNPSPKPTTNSNTTHSTIDQSQAPIRFHQMAYTTFKKIEEFESFPTDDLIGYLQVMILCLGLPFDSFALPKETRPQILDMVKSQVLTSPNYVSLVSNSSYSDAL